MASLRDVAERAGVSIATASRVATGSAAVRTETREKVERAMRDLLYITPGHTPGGLSLLIPVKDGGTPHKAVWWGGPQWGLRNTALPARAVGAHTAVTITSEATTNNLLIIAFSQISSPFSLSLTRSRLLILTERSGTRQLPSSLGPLRWLRNGRAAMSLRDFLANVSVILTVMGAAALIETAVPMFMAKPWKHPRRTANLGLTALSFLSNWLLASVAALAAVWLRPAGVFAGLAWPMWAQVLVGIVILDFSIGYLSHRTMHMWSPMWRFHQVDVSGASSETIQSKFGKSFKVSMVFLT
jgi:transcriptional regulator with XRE-family HTH domain